ncbi:hypothetical protein ACLIN3_10905 [Pseudomonas orientalis]|uniref:hypothetical protein n=1 Tax=Pseudomonas orientalis TaxID=76758 RepID=UPI003987E6ED
MTETVNLQYRPPLPMPSLYGADLNNANRQIDYQNHYGGMSDAGNPYVSSDDNKLVEDLKLSFNTFTKFLGTDHLTHEHLKVISQQPAPPRLESQKISKETSNEAVLTERDIKLAKEILNRPRVGEAIRGKGGEITRGSLETAGGTLIGNTNPNTNSADPFISYTNRDLVKELVGIFDRVRDPSEDRNWFEEKHRYIDVKTLDEMRKAPVDGSASDKFSLREIYLVKNIFDRPGLLQSLDGYKANGYAVTGSLNHDNWLKNYSLERWLENDRAEKGD